jgi:predicted Rossmann-fold nucleotide-binding protein
MNVSVFGGARANPGDDLYNDALTLGGMLARAGHTVLTGGYSGSMEAISRGAAEAGGHVIGVTCDEIENWRPMRPNAWVKEEIRLATLPDRQSGCQPGAAWRSRYPG